MKIIDNIGLPKVVAIVKDLLEDYSISELGNIYLGGARYTRKQTRKTGPTWGVCYPPNYKKNGQSKYCIRCYVNSSEDLYPLEDSHYVWIPSKNAKSGRVSKKAKWTFDNVEEAALYIMSHELFHYLAGTNQLFDRNAKPIKNLEANANWFAHGMIARFHEPLEIKM